MLEIWVRAAEELEGGGGRAGRARTVQLLLHHPKQGPVSGQDHGANNHGGAHSQQARDCQRQAQLQQQVAAQLAQRQASQLDLREGQSPE